MSSATKIEELEKELTEKDVDVENLHVFYTGPDQIVGELSEASEETLMVTNPKRILRLQQVVEGGIVISLMVSDLDFMTGGRVCVNPQIYYAVFDQPDDTKINVYEAYLDYFKRRVVNRAKEAGIVMPGNPSPFRK